MNMGNIFFAVLLAIFSFHPSDSFAATVTPQSYYQACNGAGTPGCRSAATHTALCDAYIPVASSVAPNPANKYSSCTLRNPSDQTFGPSKGDMVWGDAPPYTQKTYVFGRYQCTTDQPYINYSTNLCQPTPYAAPDPCSDKNPYIRKFYYTGAGPYVAPDHFATCAVVASEMLNCRKDATGTYCNWKFTRTGNAYTGSEVAGNGGAATDAAEVKTDPVVKSPTFANPAADPKICANCVPCPAGTVQLGLDSSGIPMCAGTGTAPPDAPKAPTTTTQPTTTTTQTDGSTKAVTVTTQTNADGSTTTTTTTKTTTTSGAVTVANDVQTSATPSGAPGRFDNLAADQNNLCKQNPNLAVCMNSSVSGTCGNITCNGDAVQCATLRAAAAMQCKQVSDEAELKASSSYALGNQILSGADPAKTSIDNLVKGDSVDLSKPNLDASGFLGAGSCLADRSFSIMGRPVTMSFATVCSNIQPLRYVVMACAYIVAYLLVARSVLNN